MQNSYTNKIVLVTGGTSGIGKATALAFAEAGAKVVITGRREKEGADVAPEITKTGGTAAFVRADVAKDADVVKAIDFVLSTHGRLDVAFNNAGVDAETEALRASEIERRALKPGAVAPDFMLPDAQGRCVRLRSLLRQGPVVLVFYRGGWCPYCNLHLRGFQRALPEFQQFGAQMVAISPQLPDNSLSTQEKDELTSAVLSDVGNKVARQFGIVFQIGEKLQKLYRKFGHPLDLFNGPDGGQHLPVPATFVVDGKGVIRLAHVDVDYTRRLDPDDVITTLRQLKA
jgi:peroxiredoxin